jgi:hypothetical protein
MNPQSTFFVKGETVFTAIQNNKISIFPYFNHSIINRKEKDKLRSALFCDITQRVVVTPYRHLGERTNPIFKWISFTLEERTDRLSLNVGKELPLYGVL